MPQLPPGPKQRFPGEFMLRFQSNAVELLRKAAEDYGDIVTLRGGSEPLVLVNHPDLIQDVFVAQNKSFKKGRGLEHARRFLGDGLLTSEGEFHKKQRRMIQPAFHRKQVERYTEIAAQEAVRASESWKDGQTIDTMSEMLQITMPIVAKSLFGTAMTERVADVTASLEITMRMFRLTMLPFADVLQKLPLPIFARLRKAEKTLDDATNDIILRRRQMGAYADQSDLLGMLLAAQDDDEPGSEGMSDKQIRDEVVTLFIAGHETTSVWLTWTWYLLSHHPEVEKRLHEELANMLGDRAPTFDDLARLPFTRNVLNESLRLYPPAWVIGRRALEEIKIAQYDISTGTIVIVAPIVMHVDRRYWPDAMTFDPDRWAGEGDACRPKYAFFPFGGGARTCIGEQFAWMEAMLLLATLAREWRLKLQPGFNAAPLPLITLRPREAMRMTTVRCS